MTREQFNSLEKGNIVFLAKRGYVVSENYGSRVSVLRSIDITNPSEWRLPRNATSIGDLQAGDPIQHAGSQNDYIIVAVYEDQYRGHATGVESKEITEADYEKWQLYDNS